MSTFSRATRAFGLSIFVAQILSGGVPPPAFHVESALDEIDDDTADGACHTAIGGPAAGKCTLRAAVMQANRMSGNVVINVPQGTYVLTIPWNAPFDDASGDLDLPEYDSDPPGAYIYLEGAGAATTIIDGGHLDRIFNIHQTRGATISGVTLRNGQADSSAGGAIRASGALTVNYCIVTGNSASDGGAIYSDLGGGATVSNSTLSGNVASGLAGGGQGGGIYIGHDTTVTITGSTISGNQAVNGGGVFNDAVGTVYLSNSTISGNSATNSGGGILNQGFGNLWTYNVTITKNEADSDADKAGGSGGGIYNNLGNCYLRSSVIMGNTHSGSPDLDDCVGTLGLFGQNAFSVLNGACNFVPQNDDAAYFVRSVNGLGPLQFNGGSTQTHALLAGSGLIDGGASSADCLNTGLVDQRGISRGAGSLCDLGAFEFDAGYLDLVFEDGFELGRLWAW